jgi:hypothetical protein
MKERIIKTYESFDLSYQDLGRFKGRINKFKLSLNDDGTYDYYENLDLSYAQLKSLTEFPIKFREINGYFACDNNQLISLRGTPLIIKGSFSCESNNLLSINHLSKVSGKFNCYYFENPLKITDRIIEIVGQMTHEQQMAELNFFKEVDLKAYGMMLDILESLGVDVKFRKEFKNIVNDKPDLKTFF